MNYKEMIEELRCLSSFVPEEMCDDNGKDVLEKAADAIESLISDSVIMVPENVDITREQLLELEKSSTIKVPYTSSENIYVIISGHYSSSLRVEGFTNTEYDAKNICASRNHTDDWWYFEKVSLMPVPIIEGKEKYLHEIGFEVSPFGGVKESWNVKPPRRFFMVEREPQVVITDFKKGIAHVYVQTEDEDYENAKKIAQDTLYQFLAKEKGI